MGLEIGQESFSAAERARFAMRLRACLAAFKGLLERPGFGVGEATIGAELEVSLVGAQGQALPLNRAVIGRAVDERLTVELDRFNLECNLRYAPLAGPSLSHLGAELRSGLQVLGDAAAQHGGRVAAIGILPTLRAADMQPSTMTDSRRYRVLASALRRARARPFEFHIDGDEPLHTLHDDVTFEGAATSLQVHLRVSPAEFSDAYNAAQLATGPALALSGNAPTFLGHRLWQETRIALFKQAVDDRDRGARARHDPARVAFGTDWLRGGALSLFEQAAQHEVVLPVCGDESEQAMMQAAAPRLEEMRVHQGTVWHWNRPVYDPAGGGHLRIELRALPSGPTVQDMLANIAFLVGLTLYLQKHVRGIPRALPFALAEHNFYRAAQHGLAAQLHWPAPDRGQPSTSRAHALCRQLLPLAAQGLAEAQVAQSEAVPLFELLRARLDNGQTGAQWQLRSLAAHEARGLSRTDALAAMLEDYLQHSASEQPVHTWPLP